MNGGPSVADSSDSWTTRPTGTTRTLDPVTYLVTQTLNGLFSAALLFLIASGLTLVFGVMRIVNIAHGSFYMLGAYVASTIVARSRSLLLGALSAVLVVAAVGFLVQSVLPAPFRRQAARADDADDGRSRWCFVIAAFMIWGGDPFTLPYPPALRGSVEAAGIVFPVVSPVRHRRGRRRRRPAVVAEREDADRREAARGGRRSGDGRRHRHQRRAAVRPASSPRAPGWPRSAA